MQTSLKTGFAQIFSCCPKKSELPKIWGGGCSPPRPPGPYAYVYSGDGFSRAPLGGTGFHGKIFLKASKKIT